MTPRKRIRNRRINVPRWKNKIPELHFKYLTDLIVYEGRKWFLNHEFKQDGPILLCGFPNCDFKTEENENNQSKDISTCDEKMMLHIKDKHWTEGIS
jgi:hypothetical protein